MAPNFLKRAGVLFFAGLLASAGCSSSSNGKDATVLGTLAGTVTSSSGAPISGVIVAPSPAAVPAATTDSSGKYKLMVPAGNYTLSFSGDNLEPATSASATVSPATTTTVNQVMAASSLKVAVNLPAALLNGGPAGFNTTVTNVTATATESGSAVTPDSITWTITDYYGTRTPPTAAAPSPATGGTTSFAIPDFESVRLGANAWMSDHYGTTGTDNDFEYIPVPERDQLLSFGTEQVRAMSYKVTATVKSGARTSTGSAVVSPVTISSGANTLPLGMMVVANAPSTSTYAWTLKYVATDAAASVGFGAPPDGVTLQGATTKNPYLVPTATGVYQLTNGSDASLYFRVSTYHGVGTSDTDKGTDNVACADCHNGQHSFADKFADWNASAHGNFYWQDPFTTPASLFKTGITGVQGTHYTEGCISCHVVGYSKVPTAVNNGWDDVAAAAGWTFPTTYDAAAWDTVTAQPALLHRAGIQCENCHGPLEPTDHSSVAAIGYNYGLVPPVASMSAGICMVCHDALTHHDRGSLWSASPHAQLDLVAEATVENRGTTAAHCGRCHSGEGFVAYVAQQQTGVAGAWGLIARPTTVAALTAAPSRPSSTVPPAAYSARLCNPNPSLAVDPSCLCAQSGDWKAAGLSDPTLTATWSAATSTSCYHDPEYYDYLSGLGLNNATAHSQTCQTCHDPHKTELRVDGNSGVNAAGFNLQNAGAGAVCVVCHNTRNGAKFSDSNLTSWSAPHTPSQSDVFAGRNAFFFGKVTPASFPASTDPSYNTAVLNASTDLPNKAAHAFMADTCADCHVKWVPPDVQAQYQPASTNHTFRTTREVCANCHGANIGDLVASQVDDKMTSLSNALGVLFQAKLNLGVDDMVGFALASDGTISDTPVVGTGAGGKVQVGANSVQRIVLSTLHGSPALIVTLNDANSTVFGAAVSGFKKSGTIIFGGSTAVPFTAGQKIAAKAFYNFLFVQGGGAHGFHNPAYVNGVLDSTTAQLAAVSAL